MGWREWVALPDLNLPAIKAKIDTGARTSALHAFKVERVKRSSGDTVRFLLHPIQRNRELVIQCEAPLLDERAVCNSGGLWEKRYVIQSHLAIGDKRLPIEITLTDRDNMRFRMLIGRQALQQYKNLLIDPSRSYLAGANDISAKGLKKLYASFSRKTEKKTSR
ncbi:MAG TPA: ATP-dependent zinc protease [Leucothrix mucor]|nr:ATP-dependent zinc protease [Leucothrix mucor]